MIPTDRLSEVFVEMADTLVADFDLVEFLHNLTDHAVEVSGADAVGIILADHHGRLQPMAASDNSAAALELFQIQNAEGPCQDCYRSHQPVVNTDLGQADHLWPVFAPRARAAGYRSVHAFPMRLRAEAIGALNLFGREPAHFDDNEVHAVQALADIATIAILQERAIAATTVLTEQLQAALSSRILIEQAKGALAQRLGVSVDDAFQLLRNQARSSGRRITDVAREVLEPRG